MISAELALAGLQTPIRTLLAGKDTLLAALKELQTAREAIDQAVATLADTGAEGVSPAVMKTALEQFKAASSGLLRARTAVRTVSRTVFRMGIDVEISPTTATVDHHAAVQFSALGDSFGYVWSLNPTGKGTIDQTGHYTAPGSNGTVQVIATSKTDSSKAASAQLTVHKKDIPREPRRRRPPRRARRS